MRTPSTRSSPLNAGLACAVAMMVASPPAFGQEPRGGFTLTELGGGLSTAVSYADLDLTTSAGRAELRRRVRHAADELCEKSGDTAPIGMAGYSCADIAARSAAAQQREAIAQATAQTYAAAATERSSGGGQAK